MLFGNGAGGGWVVGDDIREAGNVCNDIDRGGQMSWLNPGSSGHVNR